jgi:hypothetical protein
MRIATRDTVSPGRIVEHPSDCASAERTVALSVRSISSAPRTKRVDLMSSVRRTAVACADERRPVKSYANGSSENPSAGGVQNLEAKVW